MGAVDQTQAPVLTAASTLPMSSVSLAPITQGYHKDECASLFPMAVTTAQGEWQWWVPRTHLEGSHLLQVCRDNRVGVVGKV